MMENIVFLCAHPDDFTACCGTALRMRKRFSLHLWDFTKGERGLIEQGVSMEECAAMREKEEQRVASAVGAELLFLGEIDGSSFAPESTCRNMADHLREIRPRAVFTHFVPDRHVDHIMTAAALFRALKIARLAPEIYFFEFSHQSLGFQPTHIVDISSVMEEKIRLIRMYECQNADDGIVRNKIMTGRFRGQQILCEYAEAFQACGFRKDGAGCVLNELE